MACSSCNPDAHMVELIDECLAAPGPRLSDETVKLLSDLRRRFLPPEKPAHPAPQATPEAEGESTKP